MGINFPSAPAEGQVLNIAPGKSFVFRSGLWVKAPMTTALEKNYIVNPAMQISQENGTTTGTGIYGYYPADEWASYFSVLSCNSNRSVNHPDPLFRPAVISQVISTNKPVPAAGDFAFLTNRIEGLRVADLGWGTPAAKQVVLRFSCTATLAGNYAVGLRNGLNNRSYIMSVPVTTAVQVFTYVIPGDTGGTWAKDNTWGLSFSLCAASGSTYLTPTPNAWVDGNFLGFTGMSAMSTGGQYITLGQVGLYADPYKTGVAPDFKIPNYVDELRRCQRYWYRGYVTRGGINSATLANEMSAPHPVPMRVKPAAAVVGAPRVYDTTATQVITSVSANASNTKALSIHLTCASGGLTAGRAAMQYMTTDADYIAVSARM